MNEFVALVGGTAWEPTRHRCTGKWSGTTDYGFIMDGRVTFFVSNGMSHFEDKVREWSAALKTFQTKKDHHLRLLREQVERDNAAAKEEGLREVRLIDIGILSPESNGQYDFFAPYLLLEVDGRRFKHHTSDFKYAVLDDELEKYIQERNGKNRFTAACVQEPDYMVFGVRYSSTDNYYKITKNIS